MMFETARETLIQAYPNAPWRSQVQLFGLLALFVVVVAMVGALYLDLTIKAAEIGRNTQDVQADILVLQRKNADLETRLAEITSVKMMEQRAEKLGFVPMYTFNLQYLNVPGYVPKEEVKLAPESEKPVRIPSYPQALDQSLFNWIRDQIIQTSTTSPVIIPTGNTGSSDSTPP